MPTGAKTTTKTTASKPAPATDDPQSGFLPRRTDGETVVELHGKTWVPVKEN